MEQACFTLEGIGGRVIWFVTRRCAHVSCVGSAAFGSQGRFVTVSAPVNVLVIELQNTPPALNADPW
jgi:hypothetical protein